MKPRTSVLTLIAILVMAFSIPGLDDDGAEQAMADEHRAAIKQAKRLQRERDAHASMCYRAFGPQVAPAFDADDNLICIGARGQKYQVAGAKP